MYFSSSFQISNLPEGNFTIWNGEFSANLPLMIRTVVSLPSSGDSRQKTNLEEIDKMEERKSDAKEYLTRVIEGLKTDRTKLNLEVISGGVTDSLADYAEKNDIDLILIATHGRSGVSRWVRGSVADKILRSANVPVLMVRAPGTNGGI